MRRTATFDKSKNLDNRGNWNVANKTPLDAFINQPFCSSPEEVRYVPATSKTAVGKAAEIDMHDTIVLENYRRVACRSFTKRFSWLVWQALLTGRAGRSTVS